MNQSLLQAAKEISQRSGHKFDSVVKDLSAVWKDLTGHNPGIQQPIVATGVQASSYDSIEDFN